MSKPTAIAALTADLLLRSAQKFSTIEALATGRSTPLHQPALTRGQQRRLEKLAREAGRTPQAMLRFVLRDGFDLCEEDIAAALSAEAELARSGTVPHRQVSNEARAVIANHARTPRRQTA